MITKNIIINSAFKKKYSKSITYTFKNLALQTNQAHEKKQENIYYNDK